MQRGRLVGYDIIGFASGIYFGRFSRDGGLRQNSLPDRKQGFDTYLWNENEALQKEMEKSLKEIMPVA